MNPNTIPYVNNLAIEADIPLELAKAMFACATVFTADTTRYVMAGNDEQACIRANALRATFVPIGILLDIPQAKIERALIKCTELCLASFKQFLARGEM